MSQLPLQPDGNNPYGYQEESPYDFQEAMPYIPYDKENQVLQIPRTPQEELANKGGPGKQQEYRSHLTPPPIVPRQISTVPSSPKNRLSFSRGKATLLIGLVLLLTLLLWGGSLLLTIIPAANATITITPMKHDLTGTYHLSFAAGTSSDPLAIPTRQIFATSAVLTQTVAATGQGQSPATQARGTVVLSQIHLDNPKDNSPLPVFSWSDSNGITITTDQAVPIAEGATVSVPAHANVAGSSGNIPAHDLDAPGEIVDQVTKAHLGTDYVSNPAPFTGGQDASTFTFVQQSDIDKVTSTLTTQLTPDTKAQIQKQVRPGEHLVQDPQCTSKTVSDHKANDHASFVTVKVSVTCSGQAYTREAIDSTAVQAYTSAGKAQLGSGYGVVGDVIVSQPTFLSSGQGVNVTVLGIWSFQYTPDRQQEIKRLVAGKSQKDALQLLQSRKDIQNVTIVTSGGIGKAVPSTLEDIKLIVVEITGLKKPA